MGHRAKIGLSGAVGAVLLVFADVGLKGHTSATVTIRDNLMQFFGVGDPVLMAVLTLFFIIAVGVACCFIFEVDSQASAFYRGASVLAIAMTLVPATEPPPLETSPSSERISIMLKPEDGKSIASATVTVWDPKSQKVVGRSRFKGETYAFYLKEGRYRIEVEVPGYDIAVRDIEVKAGRPLSLDITLKPTWVPQFIQRLLR
ncbi:MAG: carboxypeptidase regulatory-like domain-containing protein [Gammaproteobacteria bacterium]|nr:MAG: carboxypeptidase regulatory-like domain-containing protein [Gammaproteobacteria bacterium]